MKANEFVKKFGVHIADHCLNDCASPDDRWFIHHGALIDGEDFDDLKRLVESYDLVNELGGFEKAKLHLVATDKHLGYTHVYLHENGRYCWLDDYIDHIPFCAISIDSATKAIADVESVENSKEMT